MPKKTWQPSCFMSKPSARTLTMGQNISKDLLVPLHRTNKILPFNSSKPPFCSYGVLIFTNKHTRLLKSENITQNP